MTNEDIQRTMEFIIKQQESFSENMELLREVQAKGESRISRLEGAFVNLFNTVSKLSETTAVLVEAQTRTDARFNRTDERLNSLISVVERYISEGHNGRPRS